MRQGINQGADQGVTQGVNVSGEEEDMPIVNFEFYTATNPSYQAAGGARYIPLTQGATDTLEMQCAVPKTGSASVVVIYAMSAANGGNVELYLNRRLSSSDADYDATVTSGTQFTVTPGSNTTLKALTSAASSDLAFSVTEGQLLYLKLGRTADAQDTHTGDMYVFQAYLKVV